MQSKQEFKIYDGGNLKERFAVRSRLIVIIVVVVVKAVTVNITDRLTDWCSVNYIAYIAGSGDINYYNCYLD